MYAGKAVRRGTKFLFKKAKNTLGRSRFYAQQTGLSSGLYIHQ